MVCAVMRRKRRDARRPAAADRALHPRALRLRPYAPWHFLNFLPDPHQHGSLRPTCWVSSTRRCSTCGSGSNSCSPSYPSATPALPAAAAIASAPAGAPPPEYVTRPPPVAELEAALGRATGAGGPTGCPLSST